MDNSISGRTAMCGFPPSSAPFVIASCDARHDDARVLISELSATLAAITGDSGQSHFSADDLRTARALFVLARADDGAALGCGALRPLPAEVAEVATVAELKRMYARPGTRGVGAALLAHLEQAAAGFGYRAIWLETRRVNTRAVQFYLKHGYREIPPYGPYVGRLDAICLAKTLNEPRGHHGAL